MDTTSRYDFSNIFVNLAVCMDENKLGPVKSKEDDRWQSHII
jgi:hypothetical protein